MTMQTLEEQEEQKKQLVFVDDDLVFLRTVKRWQDDCNLQGYATSNIEESLNLVKKGDIRVFVCDLIMPKQTGISVIEQVREIDQSIDLVILTGYELDNEQKKRVEKVNGKVYLKDEDLNDFLDSLVPEDKGEVEDEGEKETSIVIDLQTKVSKLEREIREYENIIPDIAKVKELSRAEGTVVSIAKDTCIVESGAGQETSKLEFPTWRLIRAEADNENCTVEHIVLDTGTTQVISDLKLKGKPMNIKYGIEELGDLTPERKKELETAEEEIKAEENDNGE